MMLDRAAAFRPWNTGGGYHSKLLGMRGVDVSGVYAIWEARGGRLLYVGESHTGNLYDTITRHFRKWAVGPNDAQGRRQGGVTYKRGAVKVGFVTTRADEAQNTQLAAIQAMKPRDNKLDGSTIVAVDEGLAALPNPPGVWRESKRTVSVPVVDAGHCGAAVRERAHAHAKRLSQRSPVVFIGHAGASVLIVRGRIVANVDAGRERAHKNPPAPAVGLTPDATIGRMVDLTYVRESTGKTYRHKFEGKQPIYSIGDGEHLLISGPGLKVGRDRFIRG